MKKNLKKVMVGVLFCCLFSNVYFVKAQTWSVPTNSSSVGSGDYIGTTSGGGTNPVVFKTNGTTRMNITATGLVGIGASGTNLYSPFQVGEGIGKMSIGTLGSGRGYIGFNAAYSGGNLNIFSADDDGDHGGAVITTDVDGSMNFYVKHVLGQNQNMVTDFSNSHRMRIDAWGSVQITGTPGTTCFWSSGNTVSMGTLLAGTHLTPSTGPSGGYKFVVSGNSSMNGSVVIGDASTITAGGTSPGVPFASAYKLFVGGGIIGEKVKVAVKTTTNWSDFVFEKSYRLMPLKEVEKFVSENKHLPDVPSAEEMVENGLDVATMDAKLLQKIEELTLYMIDVNNKMESMNKQIEGLKKENQELKRKMSQN